MQSLDGLILQKPPPLDPAWLQYAQDADLHKPRPYYPILEYQPMYAQKCRTTNAAMMAPGARDHHLSQGIEVRPFTVPSSTDGFAIPMLQYDLSPLQEPTPETATTTTTAASPAAPDGPCTIILYIHGGGLYVGEADSEDLSIRRILKDGGLPRPTVFSVGYRLMPSHPASTCVADCVDALAAVAAATGSTHILLVGSSSGGQLAAAVSQLDAERGARKPGAAVANGADDHVCTRNGTATAAAAAAEASSVVSGVVLRCPVTSDAFSGPEYVPARLLRFHTSAWEPSFATVLGGAMTRAVPRDGLARMPLEAPEATLRALAPRRHWIQVCTNDTLYSDGLAYCAALRGAGVDARIDVVAGWPHTFWLPHPRPLRGLQADEAMLEGLRWVAGAE